MRVYAEAYDAGYAHSFEVWNKAGELVAGCYGFATGGSFTSESQFTSVSNASRIGRPCSIGISPNGAIGSTTEN